MRGKQHYASIAQRASAQSGGASNCRVPGCHRPTQRSACAGLSDLYCKYHIEFARRNGSHWRRAYTAGELRPYLQAARAWVRANANSSLVTLVIQSLQSLLAEAGAPVSAYDLRGVSAEEKARVALARLRDAEVSGRTVFELALAIGTRSYHQGPDSQEFLEVNIAKTLHRRASGTHRSTSGYRMPSKYPASAGRVLRVLGHKVWDLASIAADQAAIGEVTILAQPKVAAFEVAASAHRSAEETVAREILRVKSFGMGPQRLKQYRDQLRRQAGLKPLR